jgi:ATP-binding cassette subfamily B protein
MTTLAKVCWSLPQLPDALTALAGRMGGPSAAPGITPPPAESDGEAHFRDWLDWASRRLGIDADETETAAADLETALRQAGPALVRYVDGGEWRFVVLLAGGRSGKLSVLGPDLRKYRLAASRLREALCAEQERALTPEVDALLNRAGIPAARIGRTRRALLRERLSALRISGIWLLRVPPEADFARQLRHDGLLRRTLAVLAVFAGLYLLEIAGWWLIGRGALQGRLDAGWLSAWSLVLATLIALRLLGGWLGGTLALRGALLLKRRLLAGALQMPPETIRGQGVGQSLGRVIEAEALEFLAFNGAITVPVACLELLLAAVVLHSGAGGWLHVALLAACCGIAFGFGRRLFRCLHDWTGIRLDLAHDLVEQMVGHRTRLAQQAPESRHDDEDHRLARYLPASKAFDAAAAAINGLLPRGWLLLGIAGFVPAIVAGSADALHLAIGLGGVLLGYRAMAEIAANLPGFAQAVVAWRRIAPIFHAAGPGKVPPAFHAPARHLSGAKPSSAILEARDLVFRYRPQGTSALAGCGLKLHRGDRVLLKGSSGSGKSTLAALLCGLRQPDSGLLLLHGLDSATWGVQAWRRTVAAAPQFHENYVFSAPFAFNVLMGRRWPPSAEDLLEAETVCRELGLGDLLERMPGGMLQMVGETGWRLSHGERSRVFLARALLQDAHVLVLDESFGALDPETLGQCLTYVMKRAPALLVIAHP